LTLFMASGIVGGSYQLLSKYIEKVRELGRDPTVSYPTREDLDYLSRLVESGSARNLYELLNILAQRFMERVDREAATLAFEELYGYRDEVLAVREVAKQLASWLVEIALSMGMLRLRNVEYLR